MGNREGLHECKLAKVLLYLKHQECLILQIVMIVELTQRGGMEKAEDKKQGPPPKVAPPTHRQHSFNRPLPEKSYVSLKALCSCSVYGFS